MARGVVRFKGNEVSRLIRAVKKEGLPVQAARIDRNGEIEVIVGKPGNAPALAENPWDEVLPHHAADKERPA